MTQHNARSPPLTHLALLAFAVYRSEAFASSHTRFASGRRPSGSVYNIRGGSEAAHPNLLLSPQQSQLQQLGKSQSISSTSLTVTVNGKSNTNNNGKSGSSSKMPRSMPPVGIHDNKNNNNNGGGMNMKPDTVVPAEYVAETKLPTDIGQFQLRAYRVVGLPVGTEPCVIYARDKPPFGVGTAADGSDILNEHVPVRIHDQCLTSEVFRSQRYVLLSCATLCLCYAILSDCFLVERLVAVNSVTFQSRSHNSLITLYTSSHHSPLTTHLIHY
jgi:hypothetical protein